MRYDTVQLIFQKYGINKSIEECQAIVELFELASKDPKFVETVHTMIDKNDLYNRR